MDNILKLVHLSDTHGDHNSIEKKFGILSGNVMIHTGDFTK